jgi:hypothetical protein
VLPELMQTGPKRKNVQLERTWKDAVVAAFMALSLIFA